MIGARTKAALAAARRRGTKLGANGKVLARQNRSAANAHARRIAKQVRELQVAHASIRKLTAAMNAAGVPTVSGGKWHATSVARLLERITG